MITLRFNTCFSRGIENMQVQFIVMEKLLWLDYMGMEGA